MKQFTHLIGMAAYTISMSLAGDVRTNTDIDPNKPGYQDITLDPLPTKRETAAATKLCAHLTATETRYLCTDRILRFAVKNRSRPRN